jgi:Tfp pilus assembly protein PilO
MAMGWRKGYLRYKDYFLNVFKIYQTKKDLKMFIEIILSLGTIIMFSVFALRPTILTISQLIKDNKVKADTINIMEKKINNLDLAEKNYDQIFSSLDLINSAIPQGPAPEAISRQIEGLANLYEIRILGLSTGEAVLMGQEKVKRVSRDLVALPEGASTIDLSISVTGNYQSLMNFLKDLENLRRPINIDSLVISSNTRDDQKTIVLLISGRFPYISNNIQPDNTQSQ